MANDYREENGLPRIPISEALRSVAQWRVADSNHAISSGSYQLDPSCNLNTWYGIPSAPYSTCCFTTDQAQVACMWNKPDELSGSWYSSLGFELANEGAPDPTAAVDSWKNSSSHNDMILNQGVWASISWGAIGSAFLDSGPNGPVYFLWHSETVELSCIRTDTDTDFIIARYGDPGPIGGPVPDNLARSSNGSIA